MIDGSDTTFNFKRTVCKTACLRTLIVLMTVSHIAESEVSRVFFFFFFDYKTGLVSIFIM